MKLKSKTKEVMKKIAAAVLAVGVLATSGLVASSAAYAADQELRITWEPVGSTDVTAGGTFNGVASVGCSSVQTSQGCENVQLRIKFDPNYPGLPFTVPVSSWTVVGEATGADTAFLPRSAARVEGDYFVWDLRQPMPAGKTVAVNVSFTSQANYIPVDSHAIFSAEVTSSNASNAESGEVDWHITGRGNINSYGSLDQTILVGQNTPLIPLSGYTTGIASHDGTINLTAVVPEGIEVIESSLSSGLTYDPVTRTLSATPAWSMNYGNAVSNAFASVAFTGNIVGTYHINYTVSYIPIGATTPVSVTARRSIAVVETISTGVILGKSASQTNHTLMNTPTRWAINEEANRNGRWNLVIRAQNTPLNDVIVRDAVPCMIAPDLARSHYGADPCAQPGSVYHGAVYSYPNNATGHIPEVTARFLFNDGTSEDVPMPRQLTINETNLVYPTDRTKTITEIQFLIDQIPATADGGVNMTLSIAASLVDGFTSAGHITNAARVCNEHVTNCDAEATSVITIQTGERVGTMPSGSLTYLRLGSNSNVTFPSSSITRNTTIVTDGEVEQPARTAMIVPGEIQGMTQPAATNRSYDLDFDGQGGTRVLDVLAPNGTSNFGSLRFNAANTPPGVYAIPVYAGYLTGDMTRCAGATSELITDMDGILGNPVGVPLQICKSTIMLTIIEPGTSFMLNKDVANLSNFNGWMTNGESANIAAEEEGAYRIRFINPSSDPIRDAVVYDIMPRIGDTGVMLINQPRGSEFPVPLAALPTVESTSGTWTVQYSTAEVPCRPEVVSDHAQTGAACTDDWSTTPPADLSEITGIRFSNPSVASQTGMTATLPFTVPAYVEIGDRAWNSVAGHGVGANGPLAATEPPTAGILIPRDSELKIKKWVLDEPYFQGETPENTTVTLGWYIDVTNSGERTAHNVVMTDTYPGDFEIDEISISSVEKGTFDTATGIWTIGDLAPGETVRLEFLATGPILFGSEEMDAVNRVHVVSDEQSEVPEMCATNEDLASDDDRCDTATQTVQPPPGTPIQVGNIMYEAGECNADGTFDAPYLRLPTTENVTYTVLGDIVYGQTIRITATADPGYSLETRRGWNVAEEGAEYDLYTEIIIEEPECLQPVNLRNPTVTVGVCQADGSTTAPTVTMRDNPGYTYTMSGTPVHGGSVTITVTANPGYYLNVPFDPVTQTSDWVEVEALFSYQTTVNIPDVPCDAPTAPVAPVVTQAVCQADGTTTKPSIDFVNTAGISYSIQGDAIPGTTVVVTATATDGYYIPATDGWVVSPNGRTATMSVTLDEVPCDSPLALEGPSVIQGVCNADGSITQPTITLANTANISYEIDGDVRAGNTVTVIATAGTGYYLSEGKEWTISEDGKSATFTVVLNEVPCDQPHTPVAPQVVQAVCNADGTVTAPSITLAETEGITYEIEGDVVAGNTVTIIATAAEGVRLLEADGWELNENGYTATLSVELEQVPCAQPVAPVIPTITDAVCHADGSVSAPIVTTANTAGITYSTEGDLVAGGSAIVTASANDGHRLIAAEGWTLSENGLTATMEVTFDEVPCAQPVVPVNPTYALEQCVDGELRDPWVTVANAPEGITYAIDGDIVTGNTVMVTATANDGYRLEGSEGWVLSDDGLTAMRSIELTANPCPEVPEEPVTPGSPDPEEPSKTENPGSPSSNGWLAETGIAAGVVPFAATAGLLLLVAGGALLYLRKRKAAHTGE